MSGAPWGLHWFRRDLRLPGNEALRENWRRTDGRTLGIFCFDSKFLGRSDFSHNRFAFFMKTMRALRDDWREQGGDLLVVDCLPQDFFPKLMAFCDQHGVARPSVVTWNRDYEPFARHRDAEVERMLSGFGVPTFTTRDHLLFEPHEVLKSEKAGDFYQVYSPYGKKWFSQMMSPEGQARISKQSVAAEYFERRKRDRQLFKVQWAELRGRGAFPFQDALDDFEEKNKPHVTIPIPEAGFFAAYKQLRDFRQRLQDYKEQRDFPARPSTSRSSIYLKNGSLTPTQILHELGLGKSVWTKADGPTQFTKEVAWREFYYSILFHRPEVEGRAFLKQYENLAWDNNKAHFQRWQEGTTGFPIVDAGMRELLTTGWMHNRVRMIVASFLTKDLLIDWRWGEHHFMKTLLDGDLAPNNGGWQWAASTGCDPQPYFRVFNPWLQGAKFDPDGEYIKKYVPELRQAPPQALHKEEADRTRFKYPAPMVNHSQQRDRAIALYKK